jgi:predicted MFS family arabinose efflux permease
MLAGLVAVMAWEAGAFPLTFAVVGEALPPERRATAFAVQSILVRLPRVVGAPLGGLAIAALGVILGFRVLCGVTVVIALLVLWLQRSAFRSTGAAPAAASAARPSVRRLPDQLRRLLAAECLVRFGEAIAASFVVLHVTQVSGLSILEFGSLYALQQSVAIVSYLPGARLSAWTGRRSTVALTFIFFALFPLAIGLAGSYAALVAAFVVGGLKEIGEPARKALIVDLTALDRRASQVGAYYAARNLLVVPAGVVGGLLWQQSPQLPMLAACGVSAAGLFVYLATLRRHVTLST